MRSAKGGAHENGGKHISGAEKIISEEKIMDVAQKMIRRALEHTKGKSDFISLKIEAVQEDNIQYIPCLKTVSWENQTVAEARARAQAILEDNDITRKSVEQAFHLLDTLSANMRGAILLNAVTGERLDNLGNRGVRVSKMGYATDSFVTDNLHFKEALALASKVLSAPHILAELCWSDDPEYTTGYVSAHSKYHRLTNMKPFSSELGGRVFFVDSAASHEDIRTLIHYLEEEVVLIAT